MERVVYWIFAPFNHPQTPPSDFNELIDLIFAYRVIRGANKRINVNMKMPAASMSLIQALPSFPTYFAMLLRI